MSKKKVLLRGVFINRDTNGEGVLKVGTTLIRVSTVMGILYSPFMLGTLNAKIYNLDTKEYDVTKWSDLDNVRYFYNFFKKHEDEFKV